MRKLNLARTRLILIAFADSEAQVRQPKVLRRSSHEALSKLVDGFFITPFY
jgi:hypothetical protein